MKTSIPGIIAGGNPSLPTLSKKIAFSTIVQYAGKIVQILLAATATKLIANSLTQNDYGIYGQITEYALFFSVLANLGIFSNIIRRMADAPHDSKIFINGLYLRIISALFFFLPAILYLIFTGNDNLFVTGTLLFLSSLLFDYITSVCNGMLQANYLMGRATVALLIGRLTNFAIIVLFIRNFSEAPASSLLLLVFLAGLLGSLTTVIFSLGFVRQKMKWNWKIDPAFTREVFLNSLPFGIVSVLNLLYFRFLPDYFAHLHLTDAQFATFNISFHIAQVVSLLSTFLMFSVLPGLKEYIDQKQWEKATILLRRVWQFLIPCALIVVIFGSLFGAQMIELLTHKKYFLPEFWFVLPMMFLLAAISYGYDVILITLYAVEKDWWLVKRELFSLTTALIFFLFSLAMPDATSKIFLVILGAIAGETLMLILGLRKTKKLFTNL